MLALARTCSAGSLRNFSANLFKDGHIYPSMVVNSSPFMTSTTHCQENWPKTSHGARGPLINQPDYSYRDGRPVRLSNGERFRVLKQRELVEQALRMLQELKYAKERHTLMNEEEKRLRDETIQQKFQEKCDLAADPETGRIERKAAWKRVRNARRPF